MLPSGLGWRISLILGESWLQSSPWDAIRYFSKKNKLSRLFRLRERSISRRPVDSRITQLRPAEHSSLALVNRSALIVTREIEWGQVFLGFEQANKYAIRDETGAVVALLAEEEGGFLRGVARQILRTRRGFTATVLSPNTQDVIFKLHRPPYLVSSAMYIEDGANNKIGEIQQEWHLFRRRYNLFLGNQQFAKIDGNFLAWEFELVDRHGQTKALIDRNFSGFAKELFTDAGRYVIHFGESPSASARHVKNSIRAVRPMAGSPQVRPVSLPPNCRAVIPTSSGDQLVVHSPLSMSERMIALAAAISIDFDYFSRHSYGHGMLSPFIPVPMPVPPGAADDASTVEDGGNASSRPVEMEEDEEQWNDDYEAGDENDSGSIFDLFNWDDQEE